MVIPGHNLGNSQVSVNRTIGPTLVIYLNDSNLPLVMILAIPSLSNLSICHRKCQKTLFSAAKQCINAHAKPRLLARNDKQR